MTISRIRLSLKELMSQKLSPLDTAIQLNDLEVVKHFIEKKPENVDMIVTEKGSTLLHVSAYSGSEEICHFLLQNGASVNAPNKLSFTALHYVDDENKIRIATFRVEPISMLKLTNVVGLLYTLQLTTIIPN